MSIQERYSSPTELAGRKFVVNAVEALDDMGRPVGKTTSVGFDSFAEAAQAFLEVPVEDAHLVVLDRLTTKGFAAFNPFARRVGRHTEALDHYRGKSVFTA